jgi:carboxylesterase type B
VVVVSLDWRTAKEGAYPLALADINYAIRWVKLHAKELKTAPDLVGISGQSSGGHLPCSPRCGRTIRATPPLRCRQARPRSTPR